MNKTTEERTAAAGQAVERPVRPLVDAYEDFCCVKRGYFEGCTLDEMKRSATYRGFGNYAAGWCAALEAAIKEAERRIYALDNGGNEYRRPAGADVVAAALRTLLPNVRAEGPATALPKDEDANT